MSGPKKREWDQQRGESDKHYAMFLAYRNLGPSRTIYRAFIASGKVSKSADRRAPNNWVAPANKFRWAERAAAWDVEMLLLHGQQTVAAIIALLHELATTALMALRDDTTEPKRQDAISIWKEIAPYASPEAVERMANRAPDGSKRSV